MYIDPFWAGVASTILAELAVMFIVFATAFARHLNNTNKNNSQK